jgi:UDP-2,4-diacetamido-2,4,6-trideoxy-beta-L-altropyranose hydrolase
MRIVIRVDASQHIGSGHVMRCLVLAEELKIKGHNVAFATRAQESDLNQIIQNRGFAIIGLKQVSQYRLPKNSADYEAWLHVSEEEDFKDFLKKTGDADMVIVDHYGIGKMWHEMLKNELDCTLMVIDDLVREHSADIVLDQTLNRQPHAYTALHKCLALTGTRFALLAPAFHQVRKQLAPRPESQAHRILISMGGIDAPNTTLKVLEALGRASTPFKSTVLLSERAPHYEAVKAFALKHSGWLQHYSFIDDMATFMANYSIGIGAPGSSSWERACLGIPSVIIPIADNQLTIAQELEKTKAAILLKRSEIEHRLEATLYQLIHKWPKYRVKNLALCDGQGCKRAIQEIESFISAA